MQNIRDGIMRDCAKSSGRASQEYRAEPRSYTQLSLRPSKSVIVEVLAPTFESIIKSEYNMDQVIIVLAYEGRAGKETEDRANDLIQEFSPKVKHAMAVKHPDGIPGEIIGKGGNINRAAQELVEYLYSQKIDPKRVIVTTLDADTRPHKKYFAAFKLSSEYTVCPDPIHASVPACGRIH